MLKALNVSVKGLFANKGIKYVNINQEQFLVMNFVFKNYPEWFILTEIENC